MSDFEAIQTSPDRDGDSVKITPMHEHYRIETRNVDGDFMAAYVSRMDMISIARAVLAAENQA